MANQRVLIVDDEESARRGLCELLASWGYETAMAADGLEALDRMSELSPQVIITDIIMPRLDGFQLLSHVREQYPSAAVIMLPGHGSIDTALTSIKVTHAIYY